MKEKINSLATLIYLKKEQADRNGKVPIMVKITLNGKFLKLSSKMKVSPNSWDDKLKRVKGNTKEVFEINSKIEEIIVRIKQCFQKLELTEDYVTLEKLKIAYYGEDKYKETLSGLFKTFIDGFKEEVKAKTKNKSTLYKYELTYACLEEFMLHKSKENKSIIIKTVDQVKRPDIMLPDINHSFIVDFEKYIRMNKKCGINTVSKYIRQFKTVMLIAINNNWLPKNPFAGIKFSEVPVNKEFLTMDEINLLAAKEFKIHRLELVRDVFLFCIFYSCIT